MALLQTNTKYGIAEGVELNGCAVYKGIPYAKAPTGELRWKRTVPLPEEKWEGIRKFDTYGNICPQDVPEGYNRETTPSGYSEDCLYLNVWTPANAETDKLPVLVWIHGGAFMFGSPNNVIYYAESLCKQGVVVVQIGYRMNWFGFFSHPELDGENDEHVSGNYALWDQVEALRWIRDNISAFGGDPGKVTVAGQSAGGASISALLAFKEAEGLFHGAIIESGVHDTDKLSCTLKEAEEILHGFLSEKGLGELNVEQLRALPAEELVALEIPTWFGVLAPLRPIIDGYVQPEQSYDMFRKGLLHDVPIIFGTNAYEGNMGPRDCDYDSFLEFIRKYADEDYDKFRTVYPFDRDNFEFIKHIIGRDKEFANLHLLAGRIAKVHKSPVYHYHFAQSNPQKDGSIMMPLHGRELYYTWNHLELQHGEPVIEEKQRILAEKICRYWVNFVKNGDPNGEDLPLWPHYSDDCDKHLRIEAEKLGAYNSHYPVGTELIEKMMLRAEALR